MTFSQSPGLLLNRLCTHGVLEKIESCSCESWGPPGESSWISEEVRLGQSQGTSARREVSKEAFMEGRLPEEVSCGLAVIPEVGVFWVWSPAACSGFCSLGQGEGGKERRSHALPGISFFREVTKGSGCGTGLPGFNATPAPIFVEWLWQRYCVWVSSSTQWE